MSHLVPHLALQAAICGSAVGISISPDLVGGAAVTVRYAYYSPSSTNSIVTATSGVADVIKVGKVKEAESFVDWLIRTSEAAPADEVAKLPLDFASTVDKHLYGL